VKHLEGLTDPERFKELSLLLCEQAELAEGGQLHNPAQFVQRLNRLLVELAAPRAAS
jgi:molecular chaperone HtpG